MSLLPAHHGNELLYTDDLVPTAVTEKEQTLSLLSCISDTPTQGNVSRSSCPTFTPTCPISLTIVQLSVGCSPTMICVATDTKLQPRVFETNGKERDTRKLHSITFSLLFCNNAKCN